MYIAELLFEDVSLRGSSPIVRMRHYWVSNLINSIENIRTTLETSSTQDVHNLRYRLQSGVSIVVRHAGDLLRVFSLKPGEELSSRVLKLVRLVGAQNFVQVIAHTLLLLIVYSIYRKCLEESVLCVIEPRFEVEDHSLLNELRSRSLLPFRIFDLLILRRGSRDIELHELKYIGRGPRISAGTLLAHIASALEKIADHHAKLSDAYGRNGYRFRYTVATVHSDDVELDESLIKHSKRIADAVAQLLYPQSQSGKDIQIEFIRFSDLVREAEKNLILAELIEGEVFRHRLNYRAH